MWLLTAELLPNESNEQINKHQKFTSDRHLFRMYNKLLAKILSIRCLLFFFLNRSSASQVSYMEAV